MAERGVVKSRDMGCRKVDPLVWWRGMVQIANNTWKGAIRQVVEEDNAAH
jgi:hypothetical protein